MTGRHLALAVLIALSLAAVIAIDQRRRLRGPPPAAASHPPIAVAADPAPDADDDADPLGQPVSAPGRLQVLRRRWFTLGYDNGQREPAWCSYHLAGPIRFHGRERRPARFATDPDVRRPARHEDYSGSGSIAAISPPPSPCGAAAATRRCGRPSPPPTSCRRSTR